MANPVTPAALRRKLALERVLKLVADERERQDQKWGEQNHPPCEWIAILVEEVGEATQEALNVRFGYEDHDASLIRLRSELIQVAAVAVAFVECLDRAEAGLP